MYTTEDLVFLVLQYFHEGDFKEAAHVLERESGLYFDLKYFEDLVLNGEWGDAENYLSAFTKVEDNNHSMKIYYEMRKQNKDRCKALDILLKDLKVFEAGNKELFKDLGFLLTVDDIRKESSGSGELRRRGRSSGGQRLATEKGRIGVILVGPRQGSGDQRFWSGSGALLHPMWFRRGRRSGLGRSVSSQVEGIGVDGGPVVALPSPASDSLFFCLNVVSGCCLLLGDEMVKMIFVLVFDDGDEDDYILCFLSWGR
ncbi:hypothetical protein RJT34_08949 [Clitoria ternatea]|uniref:CTLH domain-containing protein n=1 Tax=Clitoria ternatea TaxID=43366 RepID=A0AAN9PT17_CLITE